jgi:hypothetical protein
LEKKILVFNQETVDQASENLPAQKVLENLGGFFKVLTDPTRLKILYALGAGELCVFDLSVSTGASVSSVSHHLAALKRVRLVKVYWVILNLYMTYFLLFRTICPFHYSSPRGFWRAFRF